MQGRLTRRSSVTVLALTGALAAVGVGYAAIPGGGGVIHGCYADLTGQLRVIDAEAGAKCAKRETALSFNQQGPKGDTGPRGLQGEPGQDGVAEFPDTLPSGKTLRGAWSVRGVNTDVEGSQSASSSISFGFPLTKDWTWNELWEVGKPYNPNCGTGTPVPGHLCVYLAGSVNFDGVAIFGDSGGAVGDGSRYGAQLSAVAAGEGPFYAYGTWAVTAP